MPVSRGVNGRLLSLMTSILDAELRNVEVCVSAGIERVVAGGDVADAELVDDSRRKDVYPATRIVMVPRNHPIAELWIVKFGTGTEYWSRSKKILSFTENVWSPRTKYWLSLTVWTSESIVHSRKGIAECILSGRNKAQKRLGRRRSVRPE